MNGAAGESTKAARNRDGESGLGLGSEVKRLKSTLKSSAECPSCAC